MGILDPPPLNNMDMTDGSAMNVTEFDTIMMDAETRKILAEENETEAFSIKKKAQNLSTLRQSGRGQRVLTSDGDNCYGSTNREGMILTGYIRRIQQRRTYNQHK